MARASAPGFRTKRIYDDPSGSDGYRVLVDRLWPRGISKTAAALDAWQKDLAPSTELRSWFGHEARRWSDFRRRYRRELKAREPELDALRERARRGTVTLLYAAQNRELNHALVLKEAAEGGGHAKTASAGLARAKTKGTRSRVSAKRAGGNQ